MKALEGAWIKIVESVQASHFSLGIDPKVKFADPSCRDFVLSFLDGEPDYIIDLVDQAISIDQVQLLLGYGLSVNNGRPDFVIRHSYPGIRRVLQEDADRVFEKIASLWTEKYIDSVPEVDRSSPILADLLGAEPLLGEKLRRWVLDQSLHIQEFVKRVDAYNLSGLSVLINALAKDFSEGVRSANSTHAEEYKQLVRRWIEGLYENAEILKAEKFVDTYGELEVFQDMDLKDMFRESVLNELYSQLENLGEGHDIPPGPEEMREELESN